MRLAAVSLFASLLLSGCALGPVAAPLADSGIYIRGNVHGGQQPIVGAHVYLFAANTTGYGNASVSLLNSASTGLSDSVGAYVTTDSTGAFNITGDYSCTQNTQVYLYALGGDPGAGPNSAAGLLAILGNCPSAGNFLTATPFIAVNEVSTIAAAYAMSGFATDATHVSSSGTTYAQLGIANAFATAANLANLSTGAALTTTPAGNGTVPQTVIHTLANILAACINSTASSSNCTTLFANAKSNGSTGNTASDTASIAINIAHNPGANIAALYAIPGAVQIFSPTLSIQPNDFVLAINFTGGGVVRPNSIAVDSSGTIWTANQSTNSVSQFSPLGVPVSPSTGYIGGGLTIPDSIAVDLSGNAWIASAGRAAISKISSAGTVLSPSTGYTGGGLDSVGSIVVDGSNNIWTGNLATLSKFSNNGVAISTVAGYTGGGIASSVWALAIDAAGNAWAPIQTNDSSSPNVLVEFSDAGAPLSPVNGYSGGGLNHPQSVAIDHAGNVWLTNATGSPSPNYSVSKFSSTGVAISPSSGYTGAAPNYGSSIAIDGAGNVWTNGSAIAEFSNAGTPISPSTGYSGGSAAAKAIAVDSSGNIWAANYISNLITEYVGIAVPVVTPLALGIENNTLGTRP